MVWKRNCQAQELPYAGVRLRKNHSGMETGVLEQVHSRTLDGCVRTIVVWKRITNIIKRLVCIVLRENHSGMETLLQNCLDLLLLIVA